MRLFLPNKGKLVIEAKQMTHMRKKEWKGKREGVTQKHRVIQRQNDRETEKQVDR